MATYRIKRSFSIVPHSPDVVELRTGTWNPTSFTLTDDSQSGVLYRLVQLIDGTRSPSQLAKAAGVSRAEVDGLLDHLLDLGAVEEKPSSALDHYLDHLVPAAVPSGSGGGSEGILLTGDPSLTDRLAGILARSLPGLPVDVLDPASPAARLLAVASPSRLTDGLQLHQDVSAFADWRSRFVVAVDAVLNPARLLYLNRVLRELRIPWFHAVADLPFLVIGPTFEPGRSACYDCFERRVAINARESASYQRYKIALAEQVAIQGRPPLLEAVEELLVSHAALEAINYVAAGATFTQGKALTVHLPTMEFVFHTVLRMPGCPSCGALSERDDAELYFDTSALVSGIAARPATPVGR